MTITVEPAAVRAPDVLTGAEIELKLAGAPEALQALFSSPVISQRATGRGRRQQLLNVYYDTSDQRLRARGLAFRVRKHGRRFIQTLKSNDTEGLVTHRGEWEAPLPSAEPDLAVMPAGAMAVLEHLVSTGELERLFTTRVQRQVRRLRAVDQNGRQSLVEAALDLGAIETARGSQPIAEVELELLDGAPEVLYDLALELDALSPLRVETRSKSARGYALATGAKPAWHKAAPLTLGSRATVDEALRSILRACTQQWCANEAAALEGSDPEGVHQMRVGLRRLRSALSVFGPLLQPEARAWLSDGARTIVGATGPARDWDVFLAELLPPMVKARPGEPALAQLTAAAEAARAAGYEAVRAQVRTPEYTRYLLRLRHWIEASGWRRDATAEGLAWLDRPCVEFAERLLTKRHKKALRLGRHFARLSVEARHELRIALKKLRYATEFFVSLYGRKDTRVYGAALKQLQDGLGHLNDVAVAEHLVADAIASARSEAERNALNLAAGLVLGWYAKAVIDVGPSTAEAWDSFVDHEPFWR